MSIIIPTLFPFPLYSHFHSLWPPDTCPTLGSPSPTCCRRRCCHCRHRRHCHCHCYQCCRCHQCFFRCSLKLIVMFLLVDHPSLLVDCCQYVTAAVFVVLATTTIVVVVIVIALLSAAASTCKDTRTIVNRVVLFHLCLPLCPPSCGTTTTCTTSTEDRLSMPSRSALLSTFPPSEFLEFTQKNALGHHFFTQKPL